MAADPLWNAVALDRAMSVFPGGAPPAPEPDLLRLVLRPGGPVSRPAGAAGTCRPLPDRMRGRPGAPDLRAPHAEASACPLPTGAAEERPGAPSPPREQGRPR
ncbi:hypothetical protein J0910_20850 [Nocardiopsis sp. CNT-189]|uniref:hypothetical protein n=1 Tax=Nocardiopsis oceanisediminis TaxID=2816862 RepID=UPI003B30C5FA